MRKRLRKWAACWDCSPFGIRIERRCFTRWGAAACAARHRSWAREPGRWYVSTVADAEALSARIYERTTRWEEPLIQHRSELDLPLPKEWRS